MPSRATNLIHKPIGRNPQFLRTATLISGKALLCSNHRTLQWRAEARAANVRRCEGQGGKWGPERRRPMQGRPGWRAVGGGKKRKEQEYGIWGPQKVKYGESSFIEPLGLLLSFLSYLFFS